MQLFFLELHCDQRHYIRMVSMQLFFLFFQLNIHILFTFIIILLLLYNYYICNYYIIIIILLLLYYYY